VYPSRWAPKQLRVTTIVGRPLNCTIGEQSRFVGTDTENDTRDATSSVALVGDTDNQTSSDLARQILTAVSTYVGKAAHKIALAYPPVDRILALHRVEQAGAPLGILS